ncbi:hypothetical protein CCYA_CCYA06G1740 [Cyanidiococcus yangmingshanensis]|nr:hypothetical protein CCYA_CCYA06G1740 [Cyanidiococcus yangmingshanensis]
MDTDTVLQERDILMGYLGEHLDQVGAESLSRSRDTAVGDEPCRNADSFREAADGEQLNLLATLQSETKELVTGPNRRPSSSGLPLSSGITPDERSAQGLLHPAPQTPELQEPLAGMFTSACPANELNALPDNSLRGSDRNMAENPTLSPLCDDPDGGIMNTLQSYDSKQYAGPVPFQNWDGKCPNGGLSCLLRQTEGCVSAASSEVQAARRERLRAEQLSAYSSTENDCRTKSSSNSPESRSSICPHSVAEDASISTIFAEPRSTEMVESLRRHVEELEIERTRLLNELDLMRLNMERRFGLVEREIAETKISIIRSLSSGDPSEKFEVSESAVSEFQPFGPASARQGNARHSNFHDFVGCTQTVTSDRDRTGTGNAEASGNRQCSDESLNSRRSDFTGPRSVMEIRSVVARELHKTDVYGNMLKAWQAVFKPLGKHVDRNLFREAVIRLLRNQWLSDRRVSDAQKLTTNFVHPPDDLILEFWKDVVGANENATMQWKHYVDLYGSFRDREPN